MRDIVLPFLSWYLITQVVTLAALPLTLRLLRNLPDSGYVFARVLGIFLVSLLLWLGTSYGLLRNTSGGAWLALLLVAMLSLWSILQGKEKEGDVRFSFLRSSLCRLPGWTYIVTVELLFFLSFAVWTYVRAYDPAISHTEQLMDLMFINGIWSSPTYPARDPWLAGYAISYYYFGYWMLATLARFAGQPPEIAYNLGQACWFGLLFTASFGVGFNLFRLRVREYIGEAETTEETDGPPEGIAGSNGKLAMPILTGLLTAVSVALTSNLHVILEWLYAQGVRLDGLNRLVDVYNFPEHANVTGLWYMDSGWSWWWRASRVIEDIDLSGNHIVIIDEFPIFSYVLGDNHPHLLAMPFVILVIAVAMNWFFAYGQGKQGQLSVEGADSEEESDRQGSFVSSVISLATSVTRPIGLEGLLLVIAATGALLFLNTWDFPPYWLLMLLVALFTGTRRKEEVGAALRQGLARAATVGALIVVGAILLFLPYFLTAQSQAGGILPNLLHSTRLPQFLLMYGHFLLAATGLLIFSWREQPPSVAALAAIAGLVIGLPVIFLIMTGLLTANASGLTPGLAGQAGDIMASFVSRRLGQPWTFLLLGGLASLTLGMLWQRFADFGKAPRSTTFVLCLVAIGILLTYMPEFAFLRDNFGNRMNTVFKFYYQSWLLLAIAAAYAIGWHVFLTGRSLRQQGYDRGKAFYFGLAPTALALLLILACLIYPVAGAYAKIKGFGTRLPTLNGLAYVGSDELAAVDWLRRNTRPDAIILEAKGASYRVSSARISAATGRATLLGWDGHEAQWRGRAYAEMAAGRADAIREMYQSARPSTLQEHLDRWQIDFLVVGPEERAQYGVTPAVEERLNQILELAFEQGSFRIYRANGAADR